MKIYLVRHGQTDWNLRGIAQGQTDVPLNETGIAQAQALRDKVRGIDFGVCYSSPLKRAAETATIIAGHRCEIRYDDLLKERGFGEFEGRPGAEMREKAPNIGDFKINTNYGGIEPVKDLLARAEAFLAKIKRDCAGMDRVLVVGHGSMLKAIHFAIVGWDEDTDFWSWHLDNTEICDYELAEGRVERVLSDIERQLYIDLNGADLHFYREGATASTVINVNDEYLVKIENFDTMREQMEFLRMYPDSCFQKVLCSNEELSYVCFEFIKGEQFSEAEIDARDAIEQICEIVCSYGEYTHKGYGFLGHEKDSWHDFLLDEIEYAEQRIPEVSKDKVMAALEVAGREEPQQYLTHGDFGTHNFLVEKGRIRVIDPMPAVADYLYDFYFALLSDVDVFIRLGEEMVMSYFERDVEYKKALLIIALYVRMSRAAKYDAANLQKYKDLYANI